MKRDDAPPRRNVVGSGWAGRRVYLRLDCGHSRIHNPRLAVPKTAHCYECQIERETAQCQQS